MRAGNIVPMFEGKKSEKVQLFYSPITVDIFPQWLQKNKKSEWKFLGMMGAFNNSGVGLNDFG